MRTLQQLTFSNSSPNISFVNIGRFEYGTFTKLQRESFNRFSVYMSSYTNRESCRMIRGKCNCCLDTL